MKNKSYTTMPRKPMMAGGMATSADMNMRPGASQDMSKNAQMSMKAAQYMSYGGKSKSTKGA